MISRAPCQKGTVATQPGTRLLILLLSNTSECALSPSRLAPTRDPRRHRVRWHMHDPGFRARGGGQDAGDLVPGQRLVGGDVETVTDSPRFTEQPDKGPREIGVMSQCPGRCAVSLHA